MKVILLKDIAKIGKRFDIKDLPNGYATHLMRTGVVEMATDKKVSNLNSMKKANKIAKEDKQEGLVGAIAKIKSEGISIIAKANEDGGLFEGITAVKLQEVIADSIVELPISNIDLTNPIKEVGEHTIDLVDGDNVTKVKLVISPQD